MLLICCPKIKTFAMENSQLILILRTFSKKEQRDLKKWLDSPVHNQREDVTAMYDYLISANHLDHEKHLKKEKIFSKLFPKTPFDDARLRQTMHFLFKSVEEFLIWQGLQESAIQARLMLAGIYRKRKLNKSFRKTMRNLEELQENSPYRNEQYLRYKYMLEQEEYLFLESRERTIKMNLQEVSEALDATFLADKLRQSCLMLAHQAVYKINYDVGLIEEVLAYVERRQLTRLPAIGTYYYIYKMLTEHNNSEHFEALERLISQQHQYFPEEEKMGIYLHAINYCIRKMNLGEQAYIRKAFELYRQGLEEKILIPDNTIDPYLFRNVAAIGLRLKEFDWVEYFIHNYRNYLQEDYRENFFQFNLARLHFERKNYDAAMQLLARVDFDDVLVQLNAKMMLLKIYYELDEVDALESLLESMRAYLNRKEVTGYYRSNYQNIIRYTRKLVRINPYDKAPKEKLRQEIQQINPLTEREWLLRQLE